jgi:hypothetical protein
MVILDEPKARIIFQQTNENDTITTLSVCEMR